MDGILAELTLFTKRYLKFPYLLLAVVIAFAAYDSNWLLIIGIPLIYLGWVCAAPNLNLANGCLLYLVGAALVVFGLVLGTRLFYQFAIIAWSAWLGCSIEMAWRIVTKRKGYLGKDEV